MAHGYFIALEGIDGAGTTTQLHKLAGALGARGHAVVATGEPSKGPAGKLLRQALAGTWHPDEAGWALLFAADRLHHFSQTIAPALACGKIVLCDRYVLSSYAYQSIALNLPWVQQINTHAPLPDAHLYFRVAPSTAVARRQNRGGAAEHFEAQARQQQVAAAYEGLITGPGAVPHVHVVDATPPEPIVTQAALCVIESLLAATGVAVRGLKAHGVVPPAPRE